MLVAASKANLIQELFVRTADENYITARWCAINGLNTDFLWLSVHSLEKYIKAALLQNGRSSKGYSHDVVKLYSDLKAIAGDLLPGKLEKPASLDIYYWIERTPEEFMSHLLANGNAHNRYLIYGHATSGQDLHMLDGMVFAIRRLIYPLEEEVSGTGATFRDVLDRQPTFSFPMYNFPLDKIIGEKEHSDRRHAALNLNFSFATDEYGHTPIAGGSSAVNPVILRRILDPLASEDPSIAAEGVEIAMWLLANVKIPRGKPADPGVVEQIQEAVDNARAKHGLSINP
jgi:HEPN domain-containing protein